MKEARAVELPTEFELSIGDLEQSLKAVFRAREAAGELVVVDSREPADQTSTFPNEIVRCRVGKQKLDLFCKYEGGFFEDSHGHRGGVVREARAYESILAPLGVNVPPFHGAVVDERTGWTTLVLGYLRGSTRSYQQPDSEGTVARAAAWAGAFHATASSHMSVAHVIPSHDASYFIAWAHRAADYASPGRNRQALLRIAEAFADVAHELAGETVTVIHGEYYPKNVIVWKKRVYPTDWESAAVASGEIDLAALTESWAPEVVARCKAAYVEARWGKESPAGFDRRLDLARLYLHARWLGDDEADVRLRNAHRLTEVVPLAERLELV